MRLDKWKLRASSWGYIFNVKINVSVNTQFDDNKHMTRKSTLKLNEQQSLFTFNCCSLFFAWEILKRVHRNTKTIIETIHYFKRWCYVTNKSKKNNNPQNSLTLELKRELNTLVRWSNIQDQKKTQGSYDIPIIPIFCKKISKNTVWIQLRTIQTYF